MAFGFMNPDIGTVGFPRHCFFVSQSDAELPPHDGRHIAIYVGSLQGGFGRGLPKCLECSSLVA